MVKQPSMADYVKPTEKYSSSDKKQIRFNKGILDFLVMDSMPFSLVQKKGFKELIQKVDPKLTVPHRRTMDRKLDVAFQEVYF